MKKLVQTSLLTALLLSSLNLYADTTMESAPPTRQEVAEANAKANALAANAAAGVVLGINRAQLISTNSTIDESSSDSSFSKMIADLVDQAKEFKSQMDKEDKIRNKPESRRTDQLGYAYFFEGLGMDKSYCVEVILSNDRTTVERISSFTSNRDECISTAQRIENIKKVGEKVIRDGLKEFRNLLERE